MSVTCRMVRAIAPFNQDGGLSEPLQRHVSICLTCQAEMARYGKLRRQLAALMEVTVTAPESLVAAVTAVIASPERPMRPAGAHSNIGRIAATTGAVAAAAAGAVAVAMWRHSRLAMR